MTRRKPRGGLVGPISLIFLGIILLVDTLGIYAVDFWDLFLSLWPLFLIAIGIDLLIGYRSRIGTLISAILIISLFAGGLFLYNQSQVQALSRPTRGLQYQQELAEIERAEIIIEPGVGEISLSALREPKYLISSSVDGWDESSIEIDFQLNENDALYRIGIADGIVFVPPFTGANMPVWETQITSSIPIALHINNGIGDHSIDLSELEISDFRLDFGVGRSVVSMPEDGDFTARLSAGVGLQEIHLPRSLAAKVVAGTGLVVVNVPDDYVLREDAYYSPNYASSPQKVTIRIEQGIGNVIIRYTESR
jgi:hypothetical protein